MNIMCECLKIYILKRNENKAYKTSDLIKVKLYTIKA